ncbi:MAG: PAS domain S-box protein [Melioribacteraceae bacterium]|nr:PAS domain S-box protein [Melioribacteraceae bacterium]
MDFRKTPNVISFLICIFLLNTFSANYAEEIESKNILILHSYHQGYKWTDDIVSGIRSVFAKTDPEFIVHSEFMDTKKNLGEDYYKLLYDLYQKKYANQKIDVLIVADNNALDFLLDNRETCFPKIPVVFCGINDFKNQDLKGNTNITGVNEQSDPAGTINAILKIQPAVKKIHVITDNSKTGRRTKAQILDVVRNLKAKVKFKYLDRLSLFEIRDSLKSLSEDDVVIYTHFNRDIKENVFENYQSFSILRNASKVPIYGIWDFNMNQGLIGGLLTSGFYQGQKAAEITMGILNGKKADDIPIVLKSPNVMMFDYNELERFNIDESTLPENSILINEPKTIYDENPAFLITVIIAFLILSIVIVILTLNITKRKIAEAAKKESETKFKAIFDQTFVFVGLLDLKGVIYEVNKTALEFIDKKYKEIVGNNFWETDWFTYGNSDEKVHNAVISAASGNYERIEIEKKSYVGDTHYFEVLIKPVFDENKEINMLLAEGRDITIRKKAEQERNKLTNEIIQKNKELEQIVYITSHDLRTPLVNIQGFGRELIDSYNEINDIISEIECNQENKRKFLEILNTDVRESLSFIEKNIKRMDKLFSGILLYSRLDKEKPNLKNMDVSNIVKKIIRDYDKVFTEKNIGVYLAELPDAYGDESQIQHVFKYLIDNAIKYLDKSRVGNIKITGETRHSDVVYCIEDNGIGIDENQIDKIFNMFYRLNPDLTQGEGIGLAMVSKILAKNNGEIWVESEKNKGSRFFVKLSL